jgi:hypothetical protein
MQHLMSTGRKRVAWHAQHSAGSPRCGKPHGVAKGGALIETAHPPPLKTATVVPLPAVRQSVLPSITSGTIGTPASLASVKAPCLNCARRAGVVSLLRCPRPGSAPAPAPA